MNTVPFVTDGVNKELDVVIPVGRVLRFIPTFYIASVL